MRWRIRGAACAAVVGLTTGCASIPPLDNPVLVRPGVSAENPAPPSTTDLPTAEGYADVYERALDALDDYFDIIPGSRYSGVIQTQPRVAPGYEQPWKPSTPNPSERWIATFQTLRHYATVRIVAAERGGFRVYVEVYKELENAGSPTLAASSAPVFRDAAVINRQAEVIAGPAAVAGGQWIPAGEAPHRDYAFEQAILRKIQRPATLK
jgi:hypothetical protein